MSALGAGAANGGGDGQRPAIGKELVLKRPQHSECADFVSCDTLKMAEDQRARVEALLKERARAARESSDKIHQRLRAEKAEEEAKRAQEEAKRIAAVDAELALVGTKTTDMLRKCMSMIERGDKAEVEDGFKCGLHGIFNFTQNKPGMSEILTFDQQMAAAQQAARTLGINLRCYDVYSGGSSRYRYSDYVSPPPSSWRTGFHCWTNFNDSAAPVEPVEPVEPVAPVAPSAPALDEPW